MADANGTGFDRNTTIPDVGSTLSLRDHLLAMEEGLRTLAGVVAGCRIFAECAEPVDPAALSVLARSGGEAVGELRAHWRAALAEGRDGERLTGFEPAARGGR